MPGMRLPVPVALLGFTPFEREHLQAGLRAVRPAGPLYAVRFSEFAGCSLLVVDGSQPAACQEAERGGRGPCTVLIGAASAAVLPSAALRLPRPIQLPALLQALDTLVAAAPPISAEAAKVQDMLAYLLQRTPGGAAHAAAASSPAKALLLGGDKPSRRWLKQALARAGIALQQVASTSELPPALQLESPDFIFLAAGEEAVPSGADADPFQACQLLQRMPPRPGQPRPMLVLLLAADLMIERLRAERAGADAWLVPPWSESELADVLQERQRWLRERRQEQA